MISWLYNTSHDLIKTQILKSKKKKKNNIIPVTCYVYWLMFQDFQRSLRIKQKSAPPRNLSSGTARNAATDRCLFKELLFLQEVLEIRTSKTIQER